MHISAKDMSIVAVKAFSYFVFGTSQLNQVITGVCRLLELSRFYYLSLLVERC